jgi:hypothetical protein
MLRTGIRASAIVLAALTRCKRWKDAERAHRGSKRALTFGLTPGSVTPVACCSRGENAPHEASMDDTRESIRPARRICHEIEDQLAEGARCRVNLGIGYLAQLQARGGTSAPRTMAWR